MSEGGGELAGECRLAAWPSQYCAAGPSVGSVGSLGGDAQQGGLDRYASLLYPPRGQGNRQAQRQARTSCSSAQVKAGGIAGSVLGT